MIQRMLAIWSLVPLPFIRGSTFLLHQFSSVQSFSCVRLFATPWIAACQDSLSITNSQSSLRLMSIESVMPSSHLILCRPLLLLPPIPPNITVFSNESTLCMRWPKYWSSALASFLPKKSQGWSPSEYFVVYLFHWEIPTSQTKSPFSFNKIYIAFLIPSLLKTRLTFLMQPLIYIYILFTFCRLVEDISRWHQTVLVSPSQEDKGKFIPI